jgi:hypothetical protein
MQALGVLGPDGLPNTEKFQWKTIPQGAATYGEFLTTKIRAHLFCSSTVAAAFDPRISGPCWLFSGCFVCSQECL